MNEEIVGLLLTELLKWVGPENVAHEAVGGWLAETVNLQKKVRNNAEWGADPRTLFKSSRVCSSGLNPPCMHKNCLFMTAARGNAQNESMHASYTASEYLCLHSSLKVK